THIGGSKAKNGLAETDPLGQPRRLYVLYVVEEETRDRKHLQVIDACRLLRDLPPESRVLSLERPRDQRGKLAVIRVLCFRGERLILHLTNSFEVSHTMLDTIAF